MHSLRKLDPRTGSRLGVRRLPGRFLVLVAGLGLILSTSCETTTEQPASVSTSDRQKRIERLESQIEQHHQLLPAWQPWFDQLREANQISHLGEEGFWFQRRKERVMWDPELVRSIEEPFETGMKDLSRRGALISIVHFARQLEKHGIDLLLVPLPPRSAVYPDLTGIPTTLAPGETPPLLDGALRGLYLRLEKHGVEVLDLLPSFLEHRRQLYEGDKPANLRSFEELIFRRQDVHWSSLGSQLTARVIAQRVKQYPWFPETVREFGKARLVESTKWGEEHGSVVRTGIRSGRVEASTPKEPYLLRDVKIEGEAWSLNDPTSPITLLGDSFSRPEHGFPQQLLKEFGFRVDRVTVPKGNQSGQLHKLNLRGDQLSGKRLVIWQITAPSFSGQQKWQPVDVLP